MTATRSNPVGGSGKKTMTSDNPHTSRRAFKSRYYIEEIDTDADVKVDWDGNRNPIRVRALRSLRRYLDSRSVTVNCAKVFVTSKGWHLRAWTSRRLGPYETLRAQSAAEDDPMRQRFNARRVRRKERGWNILWNAKHRNGQLIYREEADESWTARASTILIS
jgi:hypothetical protein